MKIESSRFETAVYRAQDGPGARGPLCVLAGRSNVGKSSLINRLLGVRGLARTSSTPGRTQSVNIYRINESWYFADLPGYGFAKVPEAVRQAWKPLVEGFLDRQRQRVAMALLVVDARRPATEHDLMMREWLEAMDVPFLVVATKSDKLKANERAKLARDLREAHGEDAVIASVRTGLGVKEIWGRLDAALEAYREPERTRSGDAHS